MVSTRFNKVFSLCALILLASCTGKKAIEGGGLSPNFGATPKTALTITDESQLLGGPAAQGRVGDVLLANDQIRVIIQKPSKNAGIGSFGGTIIDADRGIGNQDNFGELFPLVNVEWTVNYTDFDVINDGADGSAKILRANGLIDVYDYLDVDFIGEVATTLVGQPLYFADRFDDLRDPFRVDADLRNIDPHVVTDYRLDPGTNYVRIDTTFSNTGDKPVAMPVGDYIVGGGQVSVFIPGMGYTPQLITQAQGDAPAVLFPGFPGVDISYGYFYDLSQFMQPVEEPASKDDKKKLPERYTTASISYAGVTGMVLGEQFLKILPLGSGGTPEVHFVIPPKSTRTITRYFVVGDGSASSVMDAGLKVLKIPASTLSGVVKIADGTSVAGAIVAVKKNNGGAITTFRTDAQGHFSGLVPNGKDIYSLAFGAGKYEVSVDKPGYLEQDSARAGSCNPGTVDLSKVDFVQVTCTLGDKGVVSFSGGVVDADSEKNIPARLTIVGKDPSPESAGAGTFSDLDAFKKPFGIVDAKFFNAAGGIGLTQDTSFELEPGIYHFVISHGTEYSLWEQDVTVTAGGVTEINPVPSLKRVIATPGFISADFHIHALPSPDSWFSEDRRALTAAADGLDVLQSSDHDFLTDYAPFVRQLEEKGFLKRDSIQTMVGDEITPNQYGHLHAFPLEADLQDVAHGAIDWSASPKDEISPAPDFSMSPHEIVEAVKAKFPGEIVFQVNHIADAITGLPGAAGWLTTNAYKEKFGVAPLASYADPVERRLNPAHGGSMPPFYLGETDLLFTDFTAMELTIGAQLSGDSFWQTAIPTWFNMLDLGYKITATGDSDSHHEVAVPLGFPRNYIVSSVDPSDGIGGDSFAMIDKEEYARNINQQKVVISTGPYITLKAKNEKGETATVGDVIHGKQIELTIHVVAPDWAWFDTIELYANTEPVPADDSGKLPFRGAAETPEQFAKPYHTPHYLYDPSERWSKREGSLKNWVQKDGTIEAEVTVTIRAQKDTWVVVLAKGTQETPGYRSLFPVVPDVLRDSKSPPQTFDPTKLDAFHHDPNVGAPAWGLTNPIYIDVDGDADADGNPIEPLWTQ